MSNRHLPAGQGIQGGGGGPGMDMAGGPPGPRRRQQPAPFVPQYHHQHMNPMYAANYAPYGHGPQQYYGMPPQYQNGGMPSPGGYMPYPNHYARSPPAMHQQYVPMVGVTVPPSYPRPAPQSPALATPYQPPPAQPPMPPQTPSSTHSSQMPPPPTPPTPQTQEPVPPVVHAPEPAPVEPKAPFRPPLPWLSRPDLDFPVRTTKSRRRRRVLNADSDPVSLPAVGQQEVPVDQSVSATTSTSNKAKTDGTTPTPSAQPTPTTPTTPNPVQRSRASTAASATPTSSGKPALRSGAPPAPALPTLTKSGAKDAKSSGENAANVEANATATATETAETPATEELASPPPKAPPSSWANLFAKSSAANVADKTSVVNGTAASPVTVNGHGDTNGVNGAVNGTTGSFSKANATSLAEAIASYQVDDSDGVSFLEPRGLINTGNMCYMNSVLQVLMFCVPFYDFLSQVGKKAVHSFKSETPLVDAMIMFMHEYKVIKSAPTVESLRRALKNEELERYGEPFTPEFVYDAIRQLARFASMRGGHQQDAEEFLGFMLQSLDDECTSVMGNSVMSSDSAPGSTSGVQEATDPTGDWLEVGRKQRAAVTRSSGSNNSTPITKIFGGLLRSEFRVPGLKDSITTEPYQPLQLDIGSPDVRNVVDALRGLTRPERLQGDFNSPRGKDVTATKQVFIESLPPVLILHLKRFQFDAEGNGTVKIWKKVGYPLELEIPREALSRQKRQTLSEGAMPKYKLISVVYHHGKNASGGHYTVDVRRQEGREWIRLDDTIIRRVRSEDVAEGGEEEEVKETRKDSPAPGASGNRFGAMMDEDTGDEDGWKQLTTTAGGHKKWSNVVNGNGAGSGAKGKQNKDSIKDNKVAYLLFYQRM